jgi:hypothetical protein
MKNRTHSIRDSLARLRSATQKGGILLRGVQTHEDRRKPSAKRLRQRWHVQVNRGFSD